MPSFEPKTPGKAAQGNGKPDPAAQIVEQLLAPWIHSHGCLPAPCPRDPYGCARWWLDHLQEPEDRSETYQAASIGGGIRWETGYANRTRAALAAFLAMTEAERNAVVNIVTRDKIPYRGEPFRQFIEIAEETEAMREDPERYKREALARAHRILGAKTLQRSSSAA